MEINIKGLNKNSVVVEDQKGVIVEVKSDLGKNIFRTKDGEVKTNYPDDIFLLLEIETEVNNKGVVFEDVIRFYEKPTNFTKLGKYLLKYGSIEVGTILKLSKNKSGFFIVDLE